MVDHVTTSFFCAHVITIVSSARRFLIYITDTHIKAVRRKNSRQQNTKMLLFRSFPRTSRPTTFSPTTRCIPSLARFLLVAQALLQNPWIALSAFLSTECSVAMMLSQSLSIGVHPAASDFRPGSERIKSASLSIANLED
jgi:hypothetical protein